MSRYWVALYLLFCLLQVPLYYTLGLGPQGFDLVIKRVEKGLNKRPPEVESLKEDLESAERLLGRVSGRDSRWARLYMNWADYYWFKGLLKEADEAFRQSIEIFRETHGEDSWHTRAICLRYGEFLMYRHQYAEALLYFEDGTKAVDDLQGPNTPFAIRMNCRKLMLLNYLGRPQESAELALTVVGPLQERANMFDEVFLRQVGSTLDTLSRRAFLPKPEAKDWAETLRRASKKAHERQQGLDNEA